MKWFRKYKTFDQILEGYLTEKKIVLQPKTYIGHKGKGNLFSQWLIWNNLSHKSLRKITSQNVHDFFIYLATDRDLDRTTCEKYRDTLSVYFKYALEIGEIKRVPLDRIVLALKKRDHKPKYIPAEKIKDLLIDIMQHDYQLFMGCMIQYCSAVRPGKEMLNLKVGDFDFKKKTIMVGMLNAKIGKKRYADLTEELATYCKHYGMDDADTELYLFGKKHGMGMVHICENNLTYRFNKYRDRHGIDKGIKFYSWKHTGLTDLINSGMVTLKQLQLHAGHEKITSTEKYVLDHGGITNDKLKQDFMSPMANN